MNYLFCSWPLYYKFQRGYVQVWEVLSDSLVIFNSLWIIFWTDPLLKHVVPVFFVYDHFNTGSPCAVLMSVVSADSNMGLSVYMFCDFFFFLIACSSFWNSIWKNSLRPGLFYNFQMKLKDCAGAKKHLKLSPDHLYTGQPMCLSLCHLPNLKNCKPRI